MMQSSRTHPAASEQPVEASGDEPTVGEALERVYEASQGLLLRQVELSIEQARGVLVHMLKAGFGVLLALGGWTMMLAAAVLALEEGTPRIVAFCAIGIAHVMTGAFLAHRYVRAAKAGTTR